MGRIVLVTGGARSGKSGWAERLAVAAAGSGEAAYLATAEVVDEEFRARIADHRTRRPGCFRTYEEPLLIADRVREVAGRHRVVLIECLTTWLGNVFHHLPAAERDLFIDRQLDGLLGGRPSPAVAAAPDLRTALARAETPAFRCGVDELLAGGGGGILILVANELGLGLVPADAVSRAYRDAHGRLNQRLAAAADFVYLVVAGIPRRLA
jgi:adenosylcobinamide kinase/adenosylcobinamide-phosphate guanylyltransferase